MPLSSYNQTLGKKNAAHLLRRSTFGATRNEIDLFAGLTAQEAIEKLFKLTPEPQPPVDPSTGKSWVDTAPSASGTEDGDLQKYVRAWWFGQITATGINQENRLPFLTREKIVFFLHSHFTTRIEVVNNSRALYFQNVLFRKFAFDTQGKPEFNLKLLAKKIALDNAMIILLDGRLNLKGRFNENFAREFLELYTIGKGRAGQVPPSESEGDYVYFTEKDVQTAARIFSGYDFDETFTNTDPDTDLPRCIIKADEQGNAIQHDNTLKTFSHRFNNKEIIPDSSLFINGKASEESMHDEIDQLVSMIFDQEETARNICRKIYRFYVYHNITDDIENNIITEMVSTFLANDYKIEPVIKELLSSNHFYDNSSETPADDVVGGLIKSPLDLVAGTLLFFEHQLPDYISSADKFYKQTEGIFESMSAQGMEFMNPFDVAGYEAYYQFPIWNRSWISPNMLGYRYKFIFDTMSVAMMNEEMVQIDLLEFFSKNFSVTAPEPEKLIRELATYILPLHEENTELTTPRLNYFKSQFFKLGTGLPQGPLAFWQFSWANKNTIEASKEDSRGMLQDLVNAMLQTPEYQLF